MFEIRVLSFWYRIKVVVNDIVKVLGDSLGDLVKLGIIKFLLIRVYELREGD